MDLYLICILFIYYCIIILLLHLEKDIINVFFICIHREKRFLLVFGLVRV